MSACGELFQKNPYGDPVHGRRRLRGALPGLLVFAAATVSALPGAAGATSTRARAAAGARPVRSPVHGHTFSVTVGSDPVGRPVAPGFVGVAFENRAIPQLTARDPLMPGAGAVNPVLGALLRNLAPGASPIVRIGGDSTDRTWWPIPGVARPLGVTYSLTPRWIASARALVATAGARLIVSVGLEAGEPRIDAVQARQLLDGIGAAHIVALEIGNEPELYPAVPWYRTVRSRPVPYYQNGATPVYGRPAAYSPAQYRTELSDAVRAIPHVPVAAPDTGSPEWLQALSGSLPSMPGVRVFTFHAYGLNQCVTDPTAPSFPSLPNLLTTAASRGILGGVAAAVARVHRAGESFRVDEINSVTCGGRLGVSNTLASALWELDTLMGLAADGVDGVNLHTDQTAANRLFDFSRVNGAWRAVVHPVYYGALMFSQAAPPGARILPTAAGEQTQLRSWATLGADHRVRVVLINDSIHFAARVRLRAAAKPGPASLVRLKGSGAGATQGVTLGGQTFGAQTPSGLLPAPVPQGVSARGGAYALSLPPASAALLTLPAR